VLSAARHLAEQGYATGASDRNWASCEPCVTLPAEAPAWHRKMLTDPQTSGGLLVACDPASAGKVLDIFKKQGFKHAAVIGRLMPGEPGIDVR
jgi:selenide,water dikinase